VTASGDGAIYSCTVVHRAFGPFADRTPFVVALVELAEGVRMLTRIVGADGSLPGDVRIDAAVRVTFEEMAPGGEDGAEPLILPCFRLAE
jgi:uncharacterized OB-fold protein